jgi:hypothetical protein
MTYLLQGGRIQFKSIPELKIDPRQRCGAMVIYDTKLVIFPIKLAQDEFDEEFEG